MKQLIAKDEVSQQQYDAAVAAAEAARAAVDGARALVAESEQAVIGCGKPPQPGRGERPARRRPICAPPERRPAQVDGDPRARGVGRGPRRAGDGRCSQQAELNLAYTTIAAPVAGHRQQEVASKSARSCRPASR